MTNLNDRADSAAREIATSKLISEVLLLMPDAVIALDSSGCITMANPAAEQMFGWPPEEMIGQPVEILLPPTLRAQHSALVADFSGGGDEGRIMADNRLEVRGCRRDGTEFPAEVSISKTAAGGQTQLTAVVRDISERQRSRARLNLFDELLESYSDAIVLIDVAGWISWANRSAQTIFDLDLAEGSNLFDAVGPLSGTVLRDQAIPEVIKTGWWRQELRIERGEFSLDCNVTVQGHRNETDGAMEELWVAAHDVSELKSIQQEFHYAATHDSLTGLANRTLLRDRMSSMLDDLDERSSAAVLFIDLDRFKAVNDTMGHEAGDFVLTEVADRLRSVVRSGDMVARIGGDEFVVMCNDAGPELAGVVAERIVDAIALPFAVPGGAVEIGASVGIAHARPQTDTDEMLRFADHAVYLAKSSAASIVTHQDT